MHRAWVYGAVMGIGLALAACAAPGAEATDGQGANGSGSQGEAAEGRPTDVSTQADKWLKRLEARGRKIESYQARVVYTREQQLLGDRQTRIGTVVYDQGPPPRFAIEFTHLIVSGARRERLRRYVFDGKWLAEVYPEKKQFIKRQIVPPDQQFNPLAIGEGPFPLPIGQQRARVLQRFKVRVVEPAEDDPANTVHLHLEPRKHPETGEPLSDYHRVDIWYGRENLLPRRIVVVDSVNPNTGEPEQLSRVELREAKVNELGEEDLAERFDTSTPDASEGWNVQITPWEEQGEGSSSGEQGEG